MTDPQATAQIWATSIQWMDEWGDQDQGHDYEAAFSFWNAFLSAESKFIRRAAAIEAKAGSR